MKPGPPEVLDKENRSVFTIDSMETLHTVRVLAPKTVSRRLAGCLLVLGIACLSLPQAVSSQAASERVRVPTSYANVHMGPSSGQQVLVLVPRDTILNVVGRDNEWIQVELPPELRETGMVMRWYRNEDRGWMHDSTVELIAAQSP